MGRSNIVLLFTKNKSREPEAIIQDDTSGEYYPFYFKDWRDAVHFLQYVYLKKKSLVTMELFKSWSEKYGYHEEDEFIGDLNEFHKKWKKNKILISTNVGDFQYSSSLDFSKISIWSHEF